MIVFIKLVALILVCGSSGVGLLSVRQSRLQAAHEMAQSRQRTQRLQEQGREIRTQIAQRCTPDRVIELLDAQERYVPAVQHPAKFAIGIDELESSTGYDESNERQAGWIDEAFNAEHAWILDDGVRVIVLDD